ncbi:hypothetical protein [Saccharospirillum impatiens]|uniref:hypothetical protein n=1 Tax=Saccharospirillum impatiens TaxID=169438 RepID=UPI00041B8F15|nr:hypothetical protein [Saccharospirillum impatiens]
MDNSKLLRALEKNKAQRSQSADFEPESETKPVREKPRASNVITDLLPQEQRLARQASLELMPNPDPMSKADMKKNKLVYSGMKNRAVLNAYRELRIKLIEKSTAGSANTNGGNIVVMLTSVDVNSHSILTPMNLAISFALDLNSSALLVDCNPYGSDLQRLVTSPLSVGVTDYLKDRALGLDRIIYPSGIDRVAVIPAGNETGISVEQFSSQGMEHLIYELKNRYPDRFIVINTPPVLANSEARVLSKFCDQSVITVPYGSASMDAIEDAVEALGAERVTGVVYQQ